MELADNGSPSYETGSDKQWKCLTVVECQCKTVIPAAHDDDDEVLFVSANKESLDWRPVTLDRC